MYTLPAVTRKRVPVLRPDSVPGGCVVDCTLQPASTHHTVHFMHDAATARDTPPHTAARPYPHTYMNIYIQAAASSPCFLRGVA
jgi:hypothetical protein